VNPRIRFFLKDVSFPLQGKRKLGSKLLEVIEQEKKIVGEISIIFCGDEYLSELNKSFLNKTSLTDVISFPYDDLPGIISGDVYISIPRVRENAKKFRQTFQQELYRVIVHGVLHLLGYEDRTVKEKSAMTGKEDHFLEMMAD
jgi:probable rRNA maturation factor